MQTRDRRHIRQCVACEMSNPYVIALDAQSGKSVGQVFRKTVNGGEMSNPYVIALDVPLHKVVRRVIRNTVKCVNEHVNSLVELVNLKDQSVIAADKFIDVHVTGLVATQYQQHRELKFWGTIKTNPDKDKKVDVHVDRLETPGYDPIKPGNSMPREAVDLASIADPRKTGAGDFVICQPIDRLKWDDHSNTIVVKGTGEIKSVRSSHAHCLSIKPDT